MKLRTSSRPRRGAAGGGRLLDREAKRILAEAKRQIKFVNQTNPEEENVDVQYVLSRIDIREVLRSEWEQLGSLEPNVASATHNLINAVDNFNVVITPRDELLKDRLSHYLVKLLNVPLSFLTPIPRRNFQGDFGEREVPLKNKTVLPPYFVRLELTRLSLFGLEPADRVRRVRWGFCQWGGRACIPHAGIHARKVLCPLQ
jgi:hypothetical protein